ERVEHRRRVALAGAAVDADRYRPPVGEGARRVVAGGAGDRAVARQPRIEKELLTQRNPGWPERGRRHGILGQNSRKAGLILTARLGQRSRLWKRRRLARRQWRRRGKILSERRDERETSKEQYYGDGGNAHRICPCSCVQRF